MSGITRKVKIKKVYIHEQIDVTSIEGKTKEHMLRQYEPIGVEE